MRRGLSLLALAAAVLLTGPDRSGPGAVLAAGLDFASQGDQSPIEVYSDQGIEWIQDAKKFIARGNARAARGGVVVRADTLVAHYRDKGASGTEIWKLEALNNVRITSTDTTAFGDSAVYDIDKTVLVLRGRPAKLTTPTDTVTATQSIEYWENKKLAVARGDALIDHDGKRLKADTITADLVENKTGKQEIKKADAFGNVYIRTANEIITGERGVYYADRDLATLTGSVKMTRDRNQLNGGHAEVNLATGVSKLFPNAPGQTSGGRVQGLLVPDRGLKAR
jgi:lipopolysaccharide export system protein LptA